MNLNISIEDVIALLKPKRFNLENEKFLQIQMQELFIDNKILHTREHFLDENNQPDFMVGNGILIEVKIKGQKRRIYEQLIRYSQFDEVKEILLVTNVRMGDIKLGKPFRIFNLSNAWL